MRLDVQRIWKRNMGRDDRCISDHGKEVNLCHALWIWMISILQLSFGFRLLAADLYLCSQCRLVFHFSMRVWYELCWKFRCGRSLILMNLWGRVIRRFWERFAFHLSWFYVGVVTSNCYFCRLLLIQYLYQCWRLQSCWAYKKLLFCQSEQSRYIFISICSLQ